LRRALLVLAVGIAGACADREVAKDAYDAQSHACLVAFDTRADQEACLAKVRSKWTEAGAPPAATVAQPTDGGTVVLQ